MEDISDHFIARFGAEVAFAVFAEADGVGFQIAVADHEHGVHFHLLGTRDFRFDVVVAGVEFAADFFGAEFGLDGSGVFHERFLVANGEDADLLGREPEGEVAGVVLDEEADESLVCAERGALEC